MSKGEKRMYGKTALFTTALGAAIALAAGCAGELEDVEAYRAAAHGSKTAGKTTTGPCDATPIFASKCAACHSSESPQSGLDLTSPGVADRLIGKKGNHCDTVLADPAAPESSLLYVKVSGKPTCGAAMPIGAPLPASEVACIDAWIRGLGGAGAGGAAGAGGSSGAGGASGAAGGAGSSAGAGGSGTAGSGTAGSGTAGSGTAGSASGACKAPGKTLAGGCYFLLDDQQRARDAADAACGAALAGAKLAWFGSKADQDAVLAGLGAKGTDYWIGLDCASHDASCNAKGTKWTWAGGAPIAFDAWGEVPNDGEGCARLSGTSGAYAWLDKPCATTYAAICRAP